jgi:hypothetical protein
LAVQFPDFLQDFNQKRYTYTIDNTAILQIQNKLMHPFCYKIVAALYYFFPDHFELLLSRMIRFERSFRDVELELDNIITHEYLGRLLLLKSNAGEDLVEAVACHHSTGPDPSPLICLLHLANNFCAELGMGYLHEEKVVYSAAVLRTLKLKAKKVRALRQAQAPEIEAQIKDLVERCLPSK